MNANTNNPEKPELTEYQKNFGWMAKSVMSKEVSKEIAQNLMDIFSCPNYIKKPVRK